jgi:hypothetical protein
MKFEYEILFFIMIFFMGIYRKISVELKVFAFSPKQPKKI